VTTNMASLRANRAWQIWWPSMTELQHWWIREEPLMSSTWTCAKTSFSLKLRDMGLTDGPLSGEGIGWTVTLKECGQWLNVQVETSDEWPSSGVGTWTGAV